ncbi:vomeronasal type-1 receptor 1-like [Notamacropus eugenii]|uniref:vomeronasal type-1 receptor 1-like n=1 Tax=Notamacropus eugenii TaxID=9315 RepID=UPI003B67C3AC
MNQSFTSVIDIIIFLDLVLGIVFFIQTGAGVLGNVLLLCYCTITFRTGRRLKPIYSIFFHLALANFLVLICKGVPQTMIGLGLNIFLDSVGCRFVIFLHRVARNLSVSITCLLSGFQIITISPITFSILSKLKTRMSKYIFPFCLFCWILHILASVFMFRNTQNFMKSSNKTRIWNMGFCSDSTLVSFNVSLFIILHSVPDFLCVGFMVMTSGYLVLLLQRHHQQIQHIHSSSQFLRRSPVIKATYAILVLMSTYVSFYSANSIFSFYSIQFDKYHQWLFPIAALLNACFPVISPFVLIGCDSQILHFFCSLWQKKRS